MTSTRTARSRSRRSAARLVHLVAAAALGTFVYAPVELVEPARLVLQLVVVPAATLTGLYLWKQAAIRRLLQRRQRT